MANSVFFGSYYLTYFKIVKSLNLLLKYHVLAMPEQYSRLFHKKLVCFIANFGKGL